MSGQSDEVGSNPLNVVVEFWSVLAVCAGLFLLSLAHIALCVYVPGAERTVGPITSWTWVALVTNGGGCLLLLVLGLPALRNLRTSQRHPGDDPPDRGESL